MLAAVLGLMGPERDATAWAAGSVAYVPQVTLFLTSGSQIEHFAIFSLGSPGFLASLEALTSPLSRT